MNQEILEHCLRAIQADRLQGGYDRSLTGVSRLLDDAGQDALAERLDATIPDPWPWDNVAILFTILIWWTDHDGAAVIRTLDEWMREGTNLRRIRIALAQRRSPFPDAVEMEPVLEANDRDFPEEVIQGLRDNDVWSQILAGELLAIMGQGPLLHYYGETPSKATALWQRTTQMMLDHAMTRDAGLVAAPQRVRAGLAHGMLAFGETATLMVKEPLFPAHDQRLPLAYVHTKVQHESWWQLALNAYWCWCPSGSFWMGDETEGEVLTHQTLGYDFAMGRYPVTNAEYARFIAAGGYTTAHWWTREGWAFLQPGGHPLDDQAQWITQPRWWDDAQFNQPTQPVVGISWYEAMAYCAWVSAHLGYRVRLPTSLEYERAARHTDQRCYPWGDQSPTSEHANYGETGIARPTPVGCFPLGHATEEIADLVGNVLEWLATASKKPLMLCAQEECKPDEAMLLSYAGFSDKREALRCGSRDGYRPYVRVTDNGFRMVAPTVVHHGCAIHGP